MDNKTIGYGLAALGVLGAILSFVLTSHSFSSKKFDAAIVLAVILIAAGAYMAVMPSKKAL